MNIDVWAKLFVNTLVLQFYIMKLIFRTESLLLKGPMKPDDRPLWFDVYRAFPPIVEPKFARPKPENKPIRQILYKEDIIRAYAYMLSYYART